MKIDIGRFKTLLKKLDKEGYDYLVSDRYFYDGVVNIEYLSNDDYNNMAIPKPDISIYLNVPPPIIMSRERKPDQGMEYLKKKKDYTTPKPASGIGKWLMEIEMKMLFLKK